MRVKSRKARYGVLRLLTYGIVLQAAGCSFDAQTFLNSSLESVFNNISAFLITTTLSDLLNATSGGFF